MTRWRRASRRARPAPRCASTMRPKPTARPSCCASASSRRRAVPGPAAFGPDRDQPVPRPGQRRQDRPGQGPAARGLGPVCLLLDAWYMRGSLIRTALRLGHEVIGQIRRDTALFALPPPREPGTRGRPRLYGARIDVAALPASTHRIAGYGGRSARLRHVVCRPRFLKGVIVRAVWCELEKGSGGWARTRLLLSTDPALSAPAIVEDYSKRWSIEPLFRDLKVVDGLGALWQRGRSTLLRWLHLIQIARALLVLLTARADPEVLALIRLGGWRPAATLTPGLVKDALAARFRYVEAFRLFPETRRKSGPVRSTGPPPSAAAA